MKVSKAHRAGVVLVVKPDDVKKLFDVVDEFVGGNKPPTVAIVCSDNATREFDDVAKLGGYENPKSQAITELRISRFGVETERSARITISSNSILGTLDLSLEGKDDQKVSEAYRKIEIILEGMVPWYRSIAKINAPTLMLATLGSFVLFVMVMALLDAAGVKVPPPDKRISSIITVVLLAVAAAQAALVWCTSRLFPRVTFLIGQGKARHDTLENFRWTVVLGFIVSFVASIAYGLIW